MNGLARTAVAGLIAYVLHAVVHFVVVLYRPPPDVREPAEVAILVGAVAFGVCLWFALRTEPARVLSVIGRFAFIAGIAGFVLGFVGPILLMPGANQGPLAGLFITGPLGMVCGAVAGLLHAMFAPPSADPAP